MCVRQPRLFAEFSNVNVKRDLLQCQKRPTTVSKEITFENVCQAASAFGRVFSGVSSSGCEGGRGRGGAVGS